jgi:signal transduction histidine kinase
MPFRTLGKTTDKDSLRVAIVEDEEAHFLLMKRAIKKGLATVSLFHFPEPHFCLKRIDEIDPHVIIADFLMPGMDGLEFLEALNRENKSIPVIMMTGQGDENVAVQAMKLGASDYLVKSANQFAFLPSIIEKVIREKELRDSLRESARLNELLLNSLPNPAILTSRDRVILAANRMAEEIGAKKGGYCWKDFGHCEFLPERDREYAHKHGSAPSEGTMCAHCRADEAFDTNRPTNDPEVKAFGRLWDTWWIPIDKDTLLHYAIDITSRKQAEEQIHQLSQQLLKAQEAERQRLSCDLHDVIGQDLSTLKIGLDTLLDRGEDANPELREKVSRFSGMLQNIIRSVRNMSYELRPASLDELGLAPAINQLCDEFSAVHGLHVDFSAAGMDNIDLDFDTRIALYRLIQEGLNNIRRHAEATSASVRLISSFPSIILVIEDDGKGFDVHDLTRPADPNGRMGLRSMQERVNLLFGIMKIQSRPMQGTRIRIEIPLKEQKGESN